MKKKEPVEVAYILPEPTVQTDELVTVVLSRCHTHAGKMYEAGATLEVTPDMRRWLIYQGVVDA